MSTPAPGFRPFGADPGWLAAYTVGLTRAAASDERRLEALLRVTDSRPELLEAALRRLARSRGPAGCPSEQALALLDQALRRLRQGHEQPHRSTGRLAETSAR